MTLSPLIAFSAATNLVEVEDMGESETHQHAAFLQPPRCPMSYQHRGRQWDRRRGGGGVLRQLLPGLPPPPQGATVGGFAAAVSAEPFAGQHA